MLWSNACEGGGVLPLPRRLSRRAGRRRPRQVKARGGTGLGIRRPRFVVLVALVASAATSGVSPPSANAASRVAASTSFKQFACTLLSNSDVTDAVGQSSATGRAGTATPMAGSQASVCDFAPQDGGSAFDVTVKVERYKSTPAAHNRFVSLTDRSQPIQVSALDEAAVNAGSARLRRGSDVVWIDMYVNPALPPTALTTLAAAVAKHYTSANTGVSRCGGSQSKSTRARCQGKG